jgi:hypothetical protein
MMDFDFQMEYPILRNGFRIDFKNGLNGLTSITDFSNDLYDKYRRGIISKDRAIELLDMEFYKQFENETDIDWGDLLCAVGRDFISIVFLKIHNQLSDKSYWGGLGISYTLSGLPSEDSDTLFKLFNADRIHKEYLMTEVERELFNKLPEELTIYRGCSDKEIESGNLRFSWTLDEKVAKFFAKKYKKNLNAKCSVITKIVDKSSVLAYFTGRTEEEIIFI